MLNINGYNALRNDRDYKRGGGVAALIKDTIPFSTWPQLSDPEYETIWFTLRPPRMPRMFSHITFGIIYHPPKANNWKMTQHICHCLDTVLQKHPSSGIFIIGDMNHLKDNSIRSAYNLRQIVNKPTRGNHILDKVLTNLSPLYGTPLILPQIGRSDHHAVLCQPCPDYSILDNTPVTRTTRVSGKNEKALFAGALMGTDWTPLYRLPTCQQQFEYYSRIIDDLLDTFLPVKSTVARHNDKPWITDRYRNLINQRQKALLSGEMDNYKLLRNKINRMSHQLRSTFYETKVSDLSHTNHKKWWSCLNNLMGRKQSSNAMSNLASQLANGDEETLANMINKTFQSVSCDLPKLQPTHQHPPSLLPDEYHVSVEEVEKKLMAVNPHKASGPDGIPNWILSDFPGYLAPPLAAIFNSSFIEGFIPVLWKSADVVPLPKVKPPLRLDKDLRPISLTPVVSKIQESFMHSWMWDFIKVLIDKWQFGAIRGTCTTHAIIHMLHDWLGGLDKSKDGNFAQVVLLDYAKAFDRIDANILMKKLEAMAIPDPLLRWIECFLSNRRQRVKVGQSTSNWLDIWGTVPQGTLIGVLCFIAMINDLSTDCKTIKYVDDTTIYNVTNDIHDNKLQVAVNEALGWSDSNSMRINAAKTKQMVISFSKTPPAVPNIIVNNEVIERVSNITLLGIRLNEQLTWHDHVEYMYKKANKRFFFLSQLKRTKLSSKEIVKVYLTLIRPVLEYACQAWHGGLNDNQTQLLESLQQRVMKMVYPSLTYDQAMITANIPSLYDRRETMCRRMFQDSQMADHKLFPLLPPLKDRVYNHRHCYKFHLPKVSTNRFKNTFINYCLFNKF